MNRKTSSIRTPLLWSLIHLLLLFTLAIPGINVLTVQAAMVPALVLFVRTDWKRFAVFYSLSLAALLVFAGVIGIQLALLALFFAIPAVMMGILYKRGARAQNAIVAGGLTLVGEMLLVLAYAKGSGIDLFEPIRELVTMYQTSLPANVRGAMDPDALINQLQQLLPLMLILFGAYYAWITHVLARLVTGRARGPIPALPPLRTWRLPKSLIWYFLICVLISFWINTENGSLLTMVVLNVMPVLTLAFTTQALSFLFYTVHVRKWNRALPWIAIVLLLLWREFTLLMTILGLLDTAFPLRDKWIDKTKG